MLNKMSIFRCISCNKEYNIQNNKYFGVPCGDIFCEQCISHLYNIKNKTIICPLHKKEFIIEFNKFSNYFDTLMNINRLPKEENDLGLYCIRHNKKKLKFFCEFDNNFLCENCLSQHEGHKYIDFKLNKENFAYEIDSLRKNFENLKNKYVNEKNKINQYFNNTKKNLEEQVNKINLYFNNLISIINDKKTKMIGTINNNEKINSKKLENIENIFLICDEKYNFINNEFYYINNELLNKGEYETFYKTKNNFVKLIDNFYLYISKNIFNNKELYNSKIANYICPNNGILETIKLENGIIESICGKIEEITINLNNNKLKKIYLDIKTNSLFNNYSDNQPKKEILNLSKEYNNNSMNINNNICKRNNNNQNNLDTSLNDKKSYLNDDDSFINKQLIESGYTFYLLNKNDVKNVFKQQDTEQSYNDLYINKNNSNYNKNNSIINNINNIEKIRKNNSLLNKNLLVNYKNYKNDQNSQDQNRKNNNNLLNKINESNKTKAPYKLLNIIDNNNNKNEDNFNKYKKITRTKENKSNLTHLISYNENFNTKSGGNKGKLGKEKMNSNINNKRINSIQKDNKINKNNVIIMNNKIRGNSFNNKINSEENISYIYANNKNNNSMITNNLINSYNKECSEEYSLFIQNKLNNKTKYQILTDINDNKKMNKIRNNDKILKSESTNNLEDKNKHKKMIKSKYSYRDMNKRLIIKQINNFKLNEKEYGKKRGRSNRQKNSYSQMEIMI